MLQYLKTIPFDEILSWTLTVFSVVFAVYTWIAGKKRQEFSVSCKTNEIIVSGKSNIEGLQIQYRGTEIKDLSSTLFYIWNSGNTVIQSDDIVKSKPLCIKNTGNAFILKSNIVRVCEETNAFAIIGETNQMVELSFDYVDHGEGVVLQILHSGSMQDLEVDYKIKGGNGIRERSSVKRKQREAKKDIAWDALGAFIPSFVGYSLMLVSCNMGAYIANNINITAWIGVPITVSIVLGLPALGFFIGMKIVKWINKKYHRSIPSTLLGE